MKMKFFNSAKKGLKIVFDSSKYLRQNPKLISPFLFLSIFFLAFFTFFAIYFTNNFEQNEQNKTIFMLSLFFSFFFALNLSCSTLLEMIFQDENLDDINIGAALKKTFGKNFIKILFFSMSWGIFALFIGILEMFARRFFKGATIIMAFNISSTILKKAIGLSLFLALPILIFENEKIFTSFKKSLKIIKSSPVTFATGLVGIEAFMTLLVIPALPLFLVLINCETPFAQRIAGLVLLFYFVLSSSFIVYLQQVFAVRLYLDYVEEESKN